MAATPGQPAGPASAFQSPTFEKNVSIRVNHDTGAASISPSGRDVVLASRQGLRIIDLDNPYSLPRDISNPSSSDIIDVQWSPFATRSDWIASTFNHRVLIYNLSMTPRANQAPIEARLDGHTRRVTDINFSAFHPDLLATSGVDSYILVFDVRTGRCAHKFADFSAGTEQVKWNRKDEHILASSHQGVLRIWDTRNGARPLSTIKAHATKSYGIDWHRSDPTKILTCSLDKTIKLWDNVGVNTSIDKPARIIVTDYPLWRARHTPFPNGILAMPHRGSPELALYSYKPSPSLVRADVVTAPAYTFPGHNNTAQVREFLWRSRGGVEDGLDYREFQLISWGTDQNLCLHYIDPETLSRAVGFEKGTKATELPSTTRKGALYLSYRDGPMPILETSQSEPSTALAQPRGHLAALLQNPGSSDQYNYNRHFQILQSRTTMTATPIRRNPPKVVNQISWMHGVKMNDAGRYPKRKNHDLGAEIADVGSKYRKLTFDEIDVQRRRVVVSFNGPWGDLDPSEEELQLVFIRLTITFPEDYPHLNRMDGFVSPDNQLGITVEKTTASYNETCITALKEGMQEIARVCANRQQEALEPVLCYALGERGLNDSLQLPRDDEPEPDPGPGLGGESSSEDDDNDGEFTNDLMNSSHSNANIPRPVQATVRLSAHGSLVLARIQSARSAPFSASAPLRLPRNLRHGVAKDDIFESFGRFTTPHGHDSDDTSSPTSSPGSWSPTSSPSSSFGSERGHDPRIGNFQPPLAWQKATTRFQTRSSLPSSIGVINPVKPRSIVSILSSAVEPFIPSKRVLAEEYRIFGDGPGVCLHNSEVARKHGFEDLADIWILCKLILNNEVPLEILPQQHRREQVLVLARRALVRIKRKDSGLDLQFDEADTVTNPKLKGRIKWGHHSVVTWLIPALFDHFERIADTQMLAMLSCIFSEPAAREGVTSAMAKMRQSHLPMSMEAPAFSLDYFASADAAWSLFKPSISIPSTPAHSRYATPVHEFGWHRLTKNVDTYGSHGSSNGPWGSDTLPSEPVTPYSTGNTPPNASRLPTSRSATATNTPYSTSPEQSQAAHRKAPSSNFASAFASFSKPFSNAVSASPPVKSRVDDLSTSAPTSGVTWGTTTFYSSGSHERSLGPPRTKHGKRASFGQADRVNVDYISDSDSDYNDSGVPIDGASEYTASQTPGTDDRDASGDSIKVTLKNQDKFDDEASVSAPLLDLSKEWLYRAWREQYAEMLGCWGLISRRAEVLKFNGLIPYFPPGGSRGSSKAGSISLALRKEGNENHSGPISPPLSRTSTLAPPAIGPGHFKRSPTASPRHFSFNPEASEFKPGNALSPTEEASAPQSDVFIWSEQYLHISIPPASKDEDSSLLNPHSDLDGTNDNKLHPHIHSSSNRPSISRATSHASNSSFIYHVTVTKKKGDTVYSCSICWIRVSGRFYLCPACGHVAHFDCMDDELGAEEGECVVGCGCGCGFEEEDNRTKMEAFIEGIRAWDEKGGWMPEIDRDDGYVGGGERQKERELGTPSVYEEGMYGERAVWSRDGERKKESGAERKGEGRKSGERKKVKRKAIVTGKNYF